jgi:hypothetical protein
MDAPMNITRTTGLKGGFTLLEVIIACAIFFIAGFAILELVTRSVSMARSLQQREPDAGMIAASLSLTNQLIEGSDTGDFEDLCGNLYPDYSWGRDIYEVGSNGLFQVDFFVINDKRKGAEPVKMSILLYRPQSPPGSATRPR